MNSSLGYWGHELLRPASGLIQVLVTATDPDSPAPTPTVAPPPTTVPWRLGPAKPPTLTSVPAPTPALALTKGPPRSQIFCAFDPAKLNPNPQCRPPPELDPGLVCGKSYG